MDEPIDTDVTYSRRVKMAPFTAAALRKAVDIHIQHADYKIYGGPASIAPAGAHVAVTADNGGGAGYIDLTWNEAMVARHNTAVDDAKAAAKAAAAEDPRADQGTTDPEDDDGVAAVIGERSGYGDDDVPF